MCRPLRQGANLEKRGGGEKGRERERPHLSSLFAPPYSPSFCLASYRHRKPKPLFPVFLLFDVFLVSTRENKATERESEGVGWDMSVPQKLFIDWLLNGSLFSVTSA